MIDPSHFHVSPRDRSMIQSQYGRSTKRGKKVRIRNTIKKLNEVFVELRECEGTVNARLQDMGHNK
jgi:hypothetical protein